jgi:hypothetical protein
LFEELGKGNEMGAWDHGTDGWSDRGRIGIWTSTKNSTNSIEPPRDRKKEKNIQHTGNIPLDQIYDVSPPPPFILG